MSSALTESTIWLASRLITCDLIRLARTPRTSTVSRSTALPAVLPAGTVGDGCACCAYTGAASNSPMLTAMAE
ncbi:hypothetical protein LMG31887_26060 [Xanthomonas hydrangeae]|nr:hypothetical protein LMG31887_26060 [Xanthomonas hydrangeae]CAD7734277.1 hypothetical protein LMG31887_26060 [Xanthomonas hydrangeae]